VSTVPTLTFQFVNSRRSSRAGLVALLLVGPLLLLGGAVSPAVADPGDLPEVANDHAEHSHGADGLALDRDNGAGRGKAAAGAPLATYDVDAHAAWASSQWDGLRPTTDQPDALTGPQVHAIYVVPAKATDRFDQFAAMFQADARQASTLLQSRGKAVRFDERSGAGGARYLDVTIFRSRYRANQLAGSNQFSLVANELGGSGRFSDANKKYVAWLDAGSQYCGQGTLYQDTRRTAQNNNDVARTTAIVYRPYTTTTASTGGFCRGRTLLHELGHNMGALQSAAPNDFDGAHCNDSAEDVMCYTAQAEARLGAAADTGGPVFDYGSNDYWDPASGPLPWWTVNLSRFLCPSTTGAC
jgi:hypothetical protein